MTALPMVELPSQEMFQLIFLLMSITDRQYSYPPIFLMLESDLLLM